MKPIINLIFPLVILVLITGCKNSDNTAPEIIGTLPDLAEVNIGTTSELLCVVDDDDTSELAFTWQATCGNFEGTATGQTVNWTAPGEQGECDITITVSDGEFSDEYTFTVFVVDPDAPKDVTVGVYYYPWYGGDDFHGGAYLREHLVPVQEPELGEYNDRDTDVIAQHLAWSEYAGIDLWVSSWWGPGRMTDVTMKDYILPHTDLGDMKIALFYETSGRMPDFTDMSNVEADIAYMADNYFDHPNYYKIEGKPVLFVYLTRVLSGKGLLDETMDLMRSAAAGKGYELYIVGDQVFGQPPGSIDQIGLLDAITNYDVYGSSGARMYAGQSGVNSYYEAQDGWRTKAHAAGAGFIPATSPGFNDTGVRDGHTPLSRKLTASDEFGSLFRAMIEKAVTLVDRETDYLFVVTSWNEWHEDTQIEPVAVAAATSEDDSESGEAYTAGLEYEGYGMLYLDILKEMVGK